MELLLQQLTAGLATGAIYAAMALAVANHVSTPSVTLTPQVVIDKSNIDTYFNSDNSVKQFPALPSVSAYLADQAGILKAFGNVQGIS